MKRILVCNGSRKVGFRDINVVVINGGIREEGILVMDFIEVVENCIEGGWGIERDGEKVVWGILFGSDVDMWW